MLKKIIQSGRVAKWHWTWSVIYHFHQKTTYCDIRCWFRRWVTGFHPDFRWLRTCRSGTAWLQSPLHLPRGSWYHQKHIRYWKCWCWARRWQMCWSPTGARGHKLQCCYCSVGYKIDDWDFKTFDRSVGTSFTLSILSHFSGTLHSSVFFCMKM